MPLSFNKLFILYLIPIKKTIPPICGGTEVKISRAAAEMLIPWFHVSNWHWFEDQ
jgi:hypothetical protein